LEDILRRRVLMEEVTVSLSDRLGKMSIADDAIDGSISARDEL
jgi:hypothetical protein